MLGARILILVLFSLVTAGLLAEPLEIGAYKKKWLWQGLRLRSYMMYIPNSVEEPSKLPLLFALHGGGGTSAGAARNTFDLREVAELQGWVLIYPNAVGRMWSLSDKDPKSPKVDDVEFLNRIMDEWVSDGLIDSQRVFMMGVSRGAMMSLKMVCEQAHRIRGIMPMIGPLPELLGSSCQPSRPVSIYLLGGTEDPIVPYEGGEIVIGGEAKGKVLSFEETLNLFGDHYRCRDELKPVGEIDENSEDESSIVMWTRQGCPEETYLGLVEVVGGGHTWPKGPQYLPESVIGRVNQDIDYRIILQSFFGELD